MKLAALLSGGKDSLYALYQAKKEGNDICYIVTIISENKESYMYHVPNTKFVREQAKAMKIPIIIKKTLGQKEEELIDLKNALKNLKRKGIEGVVTGAVASNYQKKRIDEICEELKLKNFSPIWGMEPTELLKKMIKDNFHIIITAVAAPPLNESWLGRKIDEKCLNELIELNKRYKISINGEGGEYETFVIDCPLFTHRIEVVESEKVWDSFTNSGILDITKIKLVEK